MDEHAPQKQKYSKRESPSMNSELQRAIYKKMLFNKYKNIKEKQNETITENKGSMLQD